jgi:hypothetical protein
MASFSIAPSEPLVILLHKEGYYLISYFSIIDPISFFKGSQRVYRHPDGRRVVIHYHHAKDTLPPGTLQSFLQGTKWNEDDLKRLKLII